MSSTVDVAIVGAGPYGLSVAAHLRGAGPSFRQFGLPMKLWRENMPRGMFLKSQGFASNLSDPDGTHTLEAFCQATGRPYADPKAAIPHHHAYEPDGKTAVVDPSDGNPHFPTRASP